MFRESRERRRCILPANGFFEWQPADTKKERPQPFAFAQPGTRILAIGGLWETVITEEGSKQGRAVLLTVPANSLVSPVHDRMPLILDAGSWDVWLDQGAPLTEVMIMMRPSLPDEWRTWRVDRALAFTSRNGQEAILPTVD